MKEYSWLIFPVVAFVVTMWIILTPSKPYSDPLWEIVPTPHSSADIIRTSVPHGWLVAYKNLAKSLVYVPDENHEWKFDKQK